VILVPLLCVVIYFPILDTAVDSVRKAVIRCILTLTLGRGRCKGDIVASHSRDRSAETSSGDHRVVEEGIVPDQRTAGRGVVTLGIDPRASDRRMGGAKQ
jgi:hypothetical protein